MCAEKGSLCIMQWRDNHVFKQSPSLRNQVPTSTHPDPVHEATLSNAHKIHNITTLRTHGDADMFQPKLNVHVLSM